MGRKPPNWNKGGISMYIIYKTKAKMFPLNYILVRLKHLK